MDKLLGGACLIGSLTDDLDDDVIMGSLGVDVRNADFAVLEVKLLDAVLNVLWNC